MAMTMTRWLKRGFGLVAMGILTLGFAWCGSAMAQFSVSITVGENCDGTFANSLGAFAPLPCAFLTDPGPGGLRGAETYNLFMPPGLVAGDLILVEFAGGPISDLIRFNPQQNGGSLVFLLRQR